MWKAFGRGYQPALMLSVFAGGMNGALRCELILVIRSKSTLGCHHDFAQYVLVLFYNSDDRIRPNGVIVFVCRTHLGPLNNLLRKIDVA